MNTQSIVILCGVVGAFLTFGVTLAWADLSTADARRSRDGRPARAGD